MVTVDDIEEWETFGVARRRARVSQLDLAAETSLAQPRISNWERRGEGLTPDQVRLVWAALERLAGDAA